MNDFLTMLLKTSPIQADCLSILPSMQENSIDSVVTDPPYELGFMGKKWDSTGIAFQVELWEQVLRVLKPGGYLLAFGGTRTHHRMMVAIEDAGFQIRDVLMWVYGSGFPKSLDIGKAIDKMKGEEKIIGYQPDRWTGKGNSLNFSSDRPQLLSKITAPATDEAKQWDGWGTALKPAYEPIILAMKPIEGTFAENVLKWRVGGLNVDGSRIDYISDNDKSTVTPQGKVTSKPIGRIGAEPDIGNESERIEFSRPKLEGRWPANLLLDEVSAETLDEQTGELALSSGGGMNRDGQGGNNVYAKQQGHKKIKTVGFGDKGGASRFFYKSKTSSKERNLGCESLYWQRANTGHVSISQEEYDSLPDKERAKGNIHPTVKPIDLLRYLSKLITPPEGIVLDPFLGSGSTQIAASLEGFQCIGIERDPVSVQIAKARYEAREKL